MAVGVGQRLRARSLERPAWLTRERALELAALGTLALLALLLRTVNLANLPYGLHGDEAWTGLDALPLLDGKNIGAFTEGALGQPSGPMWLAAPFVKLLGHTILAVRLPMALAGVATVVVGYYLLRDMFGRQAAWTGAFLLAFSSWLILFQRTGLPPALYPLSAVVATYAVWLAATREEPRYGVIAGFALGLGLYTYLSFLFFAAGLAAWAVLYYVLVTTRSPWLLLRNLAVTGAIAFIVAQPVLPHIVGSDNAGTRNNRRAFSLFETPRYKAEDSFSHHLDVLVDNGQNLLRTLFWEGRPDGTDGSGLWPGIDLLLLTMAVAGLGVSAVRYLDTRDPRYLLAPILIPFVLVPSLITIPDGAQRRALALIIPVVILAAITVSAVWNVATAAATSPLRRNIIMAGLALAALLYVEINIRRYFVETADDPLTRFVYAPQLWETARLANSLPDDTRLYFASERWSVNYEPLRFLLPEDMPRDDRSREFRGRQDWVIDRSRTGLIVLIGGYMAQMSTVAAQFPEGEQRIGPLIGDQPAYSALIVPAIPGAQPPPDLTPVTRAPAQGAAQAARPADPPQAPVPLPQQVSADATERDAQRKRDLDALIQAAEAVAARGRGFPSTNGGVQSLCQYQQLDAGCRLREGGLDPLPVEPLRRGEEFGYWYRSDGRSVTIYAGLEAPSSQDELCPQKPEHLRNVRYVYCVSRP